MGIKAIVKSSSSSSSSSYSSSSARLSIAACTAALHTHTHTQHQHTLSLIHHFCRRCIHCLMELRAFSSPSIYQIRNSVHTHCAQASASSATWLFSIEHLYWSPYPLFESWENEKSPFHRECIRIWSQNFQTHLIFKLNVKLVRLLF